MYTDEFENLLDGSSPVGELAAEERRAVAMMIDEAAPAPKKHRHLVRPFAIGAIAVAFLGGGGVAAAAVTGFWDQWAQDDPLAILHYELPSGVACEMRIGNVQEAPAEVSDLIRESLAGVDFDDADVIENAPAGEDVLSDDDSYQAAYNWTIVAYIEDALKADGLESAEPQYSAQGNCE